MSCLEKDCQHADFEKIQSYCRRRKVKLTPLRESVLKIIAAAHTPLTAYAILDELRLQRPTAQVMSVYRVLNFLLDNRLIHRLESLNAVVLCHHIEEEGHWSQWLICQHCGEVIECDLPVFEQGFAEIAQKTGFMVTTSVIELSGVCADCQQVQV